MSNQVAQVNQEAWFPPVVYSVSVFIIFAFGIVAVGLSLRDFSATKNIQSFTRASQTAGLHILIWGYYGAHVGAWVLFTPAQFTGVFGAGFLGCASLFFYSTLAPIVVALGGLLIRRVSPTIVTFTDFCRQRYGWVTFVIILLIMTFNMCVSLLAEYIAIGQLFKYFVDPQASITHPDIFIVIIQAFVVAIYTAVGGLKVSLITDQFQGVLSIALTVIVIIYIAAKFRYPLDPQQLDQKHLGKNSFVGASSWGSQIAYVFLSFYSEDLWQRNYAAKNDRVMILGATIGGLIGGLQVFFFAIIGTLSAWAGLSMLDMEGNLTFFTIFQGNQSNWITVLVVIIAVCMNSSLCDSYQNALVACLAQIYLTIKEQYDKRYGKGTDDTQNNYPSEGNSKEVDSPQSPRKDGDKNIENLGKRKITDKVFNSSSYHDFKNTLWLRIVVIVLQGILIPISLKGYNISNLTFVVLEITTYIFVPNFIGLLVHPDFYSGPQQGISICLSVIAPHIYAVLKLKNGKGPFPYSNRNVMNYVWLGKYNFYDYAIFVSIMATGLISSSILISITCAVRVIQGKYRPSQVCEKLFNYRLP